MTNRKRALLVVGVALALTAPVVVMASHQFTDVPDSNIFHEDIGWLADAKVTLGCNPPANDEFCPKEKVSREQMAAFMRRLAENKVVDAATAVTAESADTATKATSADTAAAADTAATADFANDADTVDGIDSPELLWPATAPAGRTLTGMFTIGETATAGGDRVETYASFPVPLAADSSEIHILGPGESNPACPGEYDDPAADPGHLCVWYSTFGAGTTTVDCIGGVSNGTGFCSSPFGARDGFLAAFNAGAPGVYGARGAWAVTPATVSDSAADAPSSDGTLDADTNTVSDR